MLREKAGSGPEGGSRVMTCEGPKSSLTPGPELGPAGWEEIGKSPSYYYGLPQLVNSRVVTLRLKPN